MLFRPLLVSLSPVLHKLLLRCSPALFALGEGVFLGLYWYGLLPHRTAHRALERVVVLASGAPAAGGQVFLVADLLAKRRGATGCAVFAEVLTG